MRIIFEFAGGPLDGKAVVGRLGQQDEADRYFALTHHGKVGQRFRIASDYAVEILAREQLKIDSPHHFQQHYYRVTDRLEGEQEVLIRAEYVEPASDERLAEPPGGESMSDPVERIGQRVREIVADCARSWTASYSHYWPATPPTSEGRMPHLTLHVGHAMLMRNFSVFLDARQPGYPNQPVDALGLAPVQDWFLACRCVELANDASLPRVASAVEQLSRFWLHPGLTTGGSRNHLAQVAAHCQRGYGMVAAIHWSGSQSPTSPLVELWASGNWTGSNWTGGNWTGLAGDRLARHTERLSCLPPVTLGRVDPLGTAHLLALYFPVESPSSRVSDE